MKKNPKPWFERNRHVFENEILAPAKAFVNDLGAKLESIVPDITADARVDKSIFRNYRDIRFSKEKIPYKTHLGIYFWEGKRKKLENPGFYFQFNKDSLFLGVGRHVFPKDILKKYRDAVVDPVKSEKLIKTVNRVQSLNTDYILGWKQYKQIPRGYDKDHPNAEYLLYGGIGFQYKAEIPDEFYSNKLLDYAYKIFNDISPIHFWLRRL